MNAYSDAVFGSTAVRQPRTKMLTWSVARVESSCGGSSPSAARSALVPAADEAPSPEVQARASGRMKSAAERRRIIGTRRGPDLFRTAASLRHYRERPKELGAGYRAPATFLSEPAMASGAQRMFMKLLEPIIDRSGKF